MITMRLEEQADRQNQPLASPVLFTEAFLEPAACRGAVVAQALHQPIDPKQQQVGKRQDGAGHDQLLGEKSGQRQIAGKGRYDDRDDRNPDRKPAARRAGAVKGSGPAAVPPTA